MYLWYYFIREIIYLSRLNHLQGVFNNKIVSKLFQILFHVVFWRSEKIPPILKLKSRNRIRNKFLGRDKKKIWYKRCIYIKFFEPQARYYTAFLPRFPVLSLKIKSCALFIRNFCTNSYSLRCLSKYFPS